MAAQHGKGTRPRYVLIIEDNVHHAELLTEVLDRNFAPIVIHTVDTIKDGLEFAGQSSYDLILTGAVIREERVTEVISRIAKLSEGTPIIAISGRGDEQLAAELIKRGAAEYLVKTRETLESLPQLLEKYFNRARPVKGSTRKNKHKAPERLPSASAIIREVDKLTQQALAMVGHKRRKRSFASSSEHMDQLLGQIKRLREMASKLESK